MYARVWGMKALVTQAAQIWLKLMYGIVPVLSLLCLLARTLRRGRAVYNGKDKAAAGKRILVR